MNEGISSSIAALFLTSLLVRVLPVAFNFQFPDRFAKWMETILPSAVFLNFLVYIFMQEIQIAALPALLALSVTALLAYWSRGGLFLGILGGCSSYYLLSTVFV